MIERLFRVMDIRQGVIEHNSIKLARLYNDKVRLENRIRELEQSGKSHPSLSVFAICPSSPLTIGTTEFWKPDAAGMAFDLMYAATRTALNDRFLGLADPKKPDDDARSGPRAKHRLWTNFRVR